MITKEKSKNSYFWPTLHEKIKNSYFWPTLEEKIITSHFWSTLVGKMNPAHWKLKIDQVESRTQKRTVQLKIEVMRRKTLF